ncbi:unnamed protein product, partial [Symbiodinium sp. CCMP2456]
MSAEAEYPDPLGGANTSSDGSWQQVPLQAIPTSPVSPDEPHGGSADQEPMGALSSGPAEGDELTGEQLGSLMSREDSLPAHDDDPTASHLEQQLADFASFGNGAGDWHAMNSSLVLARNLVGSAGSLVEEAILTSTIEDTFSGKAASTLLKRASDFSRFAKSIVAGKGRPLAPSEGELYAYMLHLRRTKAGATAGESFLKSYRFFMHLTGAVQNARISPRVQGAAKAMAMVKRPLWQAPPLPEEAVRLLEEFVHETEDCARASIAGFMLFCIYSSARWSDAARGTSMVMNVAGNGLVLLECSTKHYKTKAKDRKDTVLPLIALGSGLTQPSWGRVWMRKRALAGLQNSSVIMPAMSPGGNFLERAMTAAEGSLWLRELLHLQGFTGDLERFSSHSLKATALSWTAKSGTMTYEERLTQGHHCSPKHGMALLYSRDALAEIIVKVAKVVSAVSRGVFSPDLPRAERVARALHADPADFEHLPETTAEDLPAGEPQEENISEAGSDITDLGDLNDDLGAPVPEEESHSQFALDGSGGGPMAGLESAPAFIDRAKQIGISEDLLGKLTSKNLDTYGKLAFVCSSKPSSGDDAPLFDALKLTRLKRQRNELKGLELDIHTEPGHALVDRVQAMLDSAQVIHISPEKCISRHDEILGEKAEPKLALGADGNIKITKQASSLRCETTGELKLRRCFLRRALAFDQVGLASFTALESWHNRMFQALLDVPPAGYRYTTVQQLLAADQKLWQVVAQESRGDIAIGVGAPAPLDKHIAAAAANQFVLSCLTHLPKPAESPNQPWKPPKGPDKGDQKGERGGKGKGRGKGKTSHGQAQTDGPPTTSLKELLDSLPDGCVRANDEGRFICPFYNKGICRFQKRKSCRFGKHMCNFKGCGDLARQILAQSEPVTAAQVLSLFDALPHEQCDRDAEGRSFSAGVYSRVKVSLRKACNLFPETLRVVNRFVAALLPEAVYTSFAIFDQVQTREHRDRHNAFLPNYVIPLSSFQGGSVQVNEPNKQIELAVSQGPIQFCARSYEHCTLPFRGRRVVLVLFTLQQAGRISGADMKVLESLGFPMPSTALLASTDVCASMPISVAPHMRPILPPACAASSCAAVSSPPASPISAEVPRQSPSKPVKPKSSTLSATSTEGCNPLLPQGPSLAPRPPLMIDCLAKAGTVAAAALQAGWDAIPLGRRRSGLEGSPLVPADLAAPEDLQSLLDYDHSAVVDWWHFNLFFKSCSPAPASRGRPALRSADHLLGCPSSGDSASALLQRDNGLCQAVVQLLFRAYETQALVTLLGPARGWCWSLIAHFVKQRNHKAFREWYFALADQELDTCMFGAPFLTSLRLRAATASFGGFDRGCDKSHQHRPWLPCAGASAFDDASLPPDLCRALCHSASQACSGLKLHKPDAVRSRRLRAQVRASAANQPAYMPPLIPEFRVRLPLSQVPPGADYKVISRAPSSKAGDNAEPSPSKKPRLKGDGEVGDLAGVYFSMEEHLHCASQLSSPADTSTRLPDAVRRNIFAILTEGPVAVSRKRMLALKSLNERMAALASTEKELRAKMHPVVEEVTRGKAIALFRDLLEETGFPDMSVVDLLTEGVPLVGQETESPLFSKRPKPKDLEPDQLKAQAVLRRRALQRMKGLTSEQDYKALKEETAEEVAAGFLSGPYHSEQEVSDLLKTEGWSLSPRFLLRQGEDSKIRIIDDFKMSAVNRAFGSSSFLELQDTDYAV